MRTASAQTRNLPQQRVGARAWGLAVLVGLLPAAFVLSLAFGSVAIPLGDVLTILLGGTPARATWTTIVLDFRMPKAITATLAGAALSVGGLLMQTLFRNPLADPYILGVSAGASLGVALVVFIGGAAGGLLGGAVLVGDVSLALAAALGAAAALGFTLIAAQRVQSPMTLLILGVMLGYVTSSVVSVLAHFAIPERMQRYINWINGTFGGVTWSQLGVFTAAISIGLVLAAVSVKALNALLLGELYAASMGVAVRRARMLILTAAALLAGAVTAFCGPVGFLGVAVPHLCRGWLGTSDHRLLLPAAALLGGALALLADVIAQMPGSQFVLPLNAITALIGAPVVVWVILRRRGLRESFG